MSPSLPVLSGTQTKKLASQIVDTFVFDKIFDTDATQEKVFAEVSW